MDFASVVTLMGVGDGISTTGAHLMENGARASATGRVFRPWQMGACMKANGKQDTVRGLGVWWSLMGQHIEGSGTRAKGMGRAGGPAVCWRLGK